MTTTFAEAEAGQYAYNLFCSHLSRDTAFPTIAHVRLLKTQISLHIREVRSESSQDTLGSQGSKSSSGGRRRLCADLSLTCNLQEMLCLSSYFFKPSSYSIKRLLPNLPKETNIRHCNISVNWKCRNDKFELLKVSEKSEKNMIHLTFFRK